MCLLVKTSFMQCLSNLEAERYLTWINFPMDQFLLGSCADLLPGILLIRKIKLTWNLENHQLHKKDQPFAKTNPRRILKISNLWKKLTQNAQKAIPGKAIHANINSSENPSTRKLIQWSLCHTYPLKILEAFAKM